MEQCWYFLENGHQQGPVSLRRLRQLIVSGPTQPGDIGTTSITPTDCPELPERRNNHVETISVRNGGGADQRIRRPSQPPGPGPTARRKGHPVLREGICAGGYHPWGSQRL